MTTDIKLINPVERLGMVPFDATRTSDNQQFKNIRLEDYGRLPFVELDMPPMDHHVLIFNYNPPKKPIYHGCGGQHHNDLWQKDSIAVIPAFYDNQWLIPETDSSGMHILLPHSEVSKVISEAFDLDPAQTEFNSTFQTDDLQLRQISALIHEELMNDFANGYLYMESLATAASVQFVKQFSNRSAQRLFSQGKLKKAGVCKILNHIDNHIDQKITLAELAEHLCLSTFHFSRAFKETTGYSPFAYITIRRTYYAKSLLLRHKLMPISEVASRAGFTDQSHMNKQLKRFFSATAKQIRDHS